MYTSCYDKRSLYTQKKSQIYLYGVYASEILCWATWLLGDRSKHGICNIMIQKKRKQIYTLVKMAAFLKIYSKNNFYFWSEIILQYCTTGVPEGELDTSYSEFLKFFFLSTGWTMTTSIPYVSWKCFCLRKYLLNFMSCSYIVNSDLVLKFPG